MQLKKWPRLLILASSLLALSACKGTLPVRPQVDICMVSAQDSGCICSYANGSDTYFLTWEQCDKFVAIAPGAFSALGDYIISVERLASGNKKNGYPATQTVRDFVHRHSVLVRGRRSDQRF